jgi:glutamate-1-semialdehyde 2,1-aminomutase
MEAADGWRVLEARTANFCAELQSRMEGPASAGPGGLKPAPPSIQVIRHASIFWIRQTSPQPVRSVATLPVSQAAWYARFFHAALRRGVYLPPAAFEVCFVSMAHDDAVLARAADILAAAAKEAG